MLFFLLSLQFLNLLFQLWFYSLQLLLTLLLLQMFHFNLLKFAWIKGIICSAHTFLPLSLLQICHLLLIPIIVVLIILIIHSQHIFMLFFLNFWSHLCVRQKLSCTLLQKFFLILFLYFLNHPLLLEQFIKCFRHCLDWNIIKCISVWRQAFFYLLLLALHKLIVAVRQI